jgi:hypothetical protein
MKSHFIQNCNSYASPCSYICIYYGEIVANGKLESFAGAPKTMRRALVESTGTHTKEIHFSTKSTNTAVRWKTFPPEPTPPSNWCWCSRKAFAIAALIKAPPPPQPWKFADALTQPNREKLRWLAGDSGVRVVAARLLVVVLSKKKISIF